MTINTSQLRNAATCSECGFTTTDIGLLAHHSCDIQKGGGRCEDYPCCGHEDGDCNGLRYGSDEAIKEQVYRDIATGHGDCDHQDGVYNCDSSYDEDDYDESLDLDYESDSQGIYPEFTHG